MEIKIVPMITVIVTIFFTSPTLSVNQREYKHSVDYSFQMPYTYHKHRTHFAKLTI